MKTKIPAITNKIYTFMPHKVYAFTLAEVLKFSERGVKKCLHLFARVSVNQEPTRIIKRQSAFTLAEVLITLAIIGVVAALTIPSVVHNYQKQETIARLKKTYSALSNTTNLAIMDNGPVERWQIGLDSTRDAAVDFSKQYLIPYLKVAHNCEYDLTGKCEHKYKTRNSAGYTTSGISGTKFYLNDGTLLVIDVENRTDVDAKTITTTIDLNGQKGPNIAGRDVFSLRYIISHKDYKKMQGKFIPNCFGLNIYNDRNYWIDNATFGCKKGNGVCCAAIIINDGWEIKDDYPW